MTQPGREQLEYLVQFIQPEKTFAGLPGAAALDDAVLAALLGTEIKTYTDIKAAFGERAREVAQELLEDGAFARKVDTLPFEPGATVVGLGDSITADRQSWLEILRHLLDLRRPGDAIKVVNAGVSGDTTAQVISRFTDVVALQPGWIITLVGTNDARRHGGSSTKTLVSPEETEKNLVMLHNFATAQTSARWLWLTPANVIEEKIANNWFLAPLQLSWRHEDIDNVAEIVRKFDPVIDLQAVFGKPAKAEFLLPDGLHPSLEGQRAIVTALVHHLNAL